VIESASKPKSGAQKRTEARDAILDRLKGNGVTPESYAAQDAATKAQMESYIRANNSKATADHIIDALKNSKAQGGVVVPKRKQGRYSRRGIWYGPKEPK
jgi:hypothetical protein